MSDCAVCSFCGKITTAPRLILSPTSRRGLCLDCATSGGDVLHAIDRVHRLELRMGKGHGVEHFVAKRLGWLVMRQAEDRAK